MQGHSADPQHPTAPHSHWQPPRSLSGKPSPANTSTRDVKVHPQTLVLKLEDSKIEGHFIVIANTKIKRL